jgi:O-antigen/teichoic acid export membrane protein
LNLQRLQRSEFGRNVLKLGLGTAIGQGAVLIASPIWSRLYAPVDFAQLGLFVAFVSTATVVLSLRYDLAIPQGRRNDEAPHLLGLCLVVIAPISLLSGLSLAAMIATDLLGYGSLPMIAAPIAAAVLLVTGIFTAARYWHVGGGEFGLISRSLVQQGIGRALVPILLAPFKLGWIGLIAGEAVGRTLGVRRLLQPLMPLLRDLRRAASWRQLRQTAEGYRRFPLIFLPSAFLDAVASAVPLPVFITAHGLASGGQFMLALQVVAAPSALLCAALADVYHQRLVATARQSAQEVTGYLWRSAARLLGVSLLALLPLCVLAPLCADWVFGPRWHGVGTMIAMLAPSTAISIGASTLSRAFVLSRIPQVKLVADVIKLVLPISGILIGQLMFHSASASVMWYSIMYAVSYALYFVVIVYSVRPLNQVTIA